MPKDRFSGHAKAYAQFRPTYPAELYRFLLGLLPNPWACSVWDCGTGNGQVALALSSLVGYISATDISTAQMEQAVAQPNIQYIATSAEKTPFPDQYFDLITVAQALHWFDLDLFYPEVRRVARPCAILAVWGYGLLQISPEIDGLIRQFYHAKIGKYWDKERQQIDRAYQDIPFPFEEITEKPSFAIAVEWTIEQLEGYLGTWSSVRRYMQLEQHDPVPALIEAIRPFWQPTVLPIQFPIFWRIGRV